MTFPEPDVYACHARPHSYAFHEGGHVLVAKGVGGRPFLVRMHEWGGATEFDGVTALESVTCAVAGAVAERVVFGFEDDPRASLGDFQTAYGFAMKVAAEEPALSASTRLHAGVLATETRSVPDIVNDLVAARLRRAHEIVREAEAQAFRILRGNRTTLCLISNALERRGELGEAQIGELVAEGLELQRFAWRTR